MTDDTAPTKNDSFDFTGCFLTFFLLFGLGVTLIASVVFALRCAWTAGA